MDLLTAENIGSLPNQPGIYKIYALNEDGMPLHINRFGGTDKSGLLYIGRTTKQTLKKRIYNFFATTKLGALSTNHSGALKYRRVGRVRKVLGQHELYFDTQICYNSVVLEAEMLDNYRQQFGEYPPLNK